MDPVLEQTASRIFADHAGSPNDAWSAIAENGLTRLWVSEAQGGFGLPPAEGFGLVKLAGAHAVPLPVAETLVATWLLSEAGIESPDGRMSLLIEGWQRAIAFGNCAEHVVRIAGRQVVLHRGPVADCLESIGEDPASDAAALRGELVARGTLESDVALPFAALTRAVQICGALDAVLAITIGFAAQRVQFGRSLSKFQAIQHLLSEMAAEVAAASAAVDAAIATVRSGAPMDFQAVAVAKFRAGRAAGIVSEHAHQIHGAIGYTQEYALARFTRRLWQWREEFGGETYWANELGLAALREAGALWPKLTARAMVPSV